MKIDPADVGRMKVDLFAKTKVPGDVAIGGEKFKADVSLSGKSSILSVKKHYSIKLLDGKYKKVKSYKLLGQLRDHSLLRSYLAHKVFEAEGFDVSKFESVVVYLNKELLGLYSMVEDIDENFYLKRDISPIAIYKGELGEADFESGKLENSGKPNLGFQGEIGSESYEELRSLIRLVNQTPSKDDLGLKVEDLIDIDNYIAYAATCIVLNQWDGQDNNYYLYRTQSDKRFKVTPWDFDRILEEPLPYSAVDVLGGRNNLTKWIISHDEWGPKYTAKVKSLLEKYTPEKIESMLVKQEKKIAEAKQNDPYIQAFPKEGSSELKGIYARWREEVLAAIK
jgi:spore coat protein H